MAPEQLLRARPAHIPGPTFLTYTPNGRKLITAGLNNAIRVFLSGSDAEPTNIDDCQESNTAIVATNDFFITGSEDGTVCKYSLESNSLDQILVRCTLPIRDLALSPDGNWVAVASEELVVKVVNTNDMSRVLYLRDQAKPVKHVSFDPSGTLLSVTSHDGQIYVYSLSSEQPELIKKLVGFTSSFEPDAEASSKAVWHPDGRAFAVATPTRDVQVVSKGDWERQRIFRSGHRGDITASAWSPNGALLVTSGSDRSLVLWDNRTQSILKKQEDVRATVLDMVWHPVENILSYTNNDGELYINTDFVPLEQASLLEKGLQPAPFIHDPLSEISGNSRRPQINGAKEAMPLGRGRRGSPDSLDDILGPDGMSDGGFIEDDDGAGYAEHVNGFGKRSNAHLDELAGRNGKRHAGDDVWQPQVHPPFQPGSTPWRGNRKYLCLNLTGFVWTVDQDSHHTVTVEFYDREFHRDFHFTDPFLYDKACLNDNGTLFSCPSSDRHPAMLYYRPHETWTARTDWRTELPKNENVIAMSLSDSYIVVTTATNYVRVYTLFGTPIRVYRQKSSPALTCTSWRDYVLTVGNGSVSSDGTTRLLYTIENVKRDEMFQSEDIVALSEGAELKNVFFSDTGDPCIYDSEGVLLVLLHWRTPGQARWVPLLDTKQLDRLADGKREETYWPVAVAQEKFHCIILKGGDQYPYFPRPLLTEFDFQLPLTAKTKIDDDDLDNEKQTLEESFVRNSVMLDLLEDVVTATNASHSQRSELGRRQVEVDKVLLQLLAAECREGEEKGMKALEIVGLLRDKSGKMLEAAGKIATRFERDVLGDKIREMAERMLAGIRDEESK
ncbi:WD40 repeat-like protein [Viridothelium virens]|uniref:WD40 repeat-like protein n=1 Tax=Viridothelium virens TaxID=1048519 RepID=A0A6A6GWM3_VIRVR|nr:WD40 repeat-like protein [Viridothelium virens]